MVPSTVYCLQDEQPKAETARSYRILVVVTEPQQERYLRQYAEALAASQSAEVGVLYDLQPRDNSIPSCRLEAPVNGGSGALAVRDLLSGESLATHVREVAESWPFDMVIAQWPGADVDIGVYACLVKDLDVIAVLARHVHRSLRRVLVPAGGGAHALEGIRVADALAKSWSLDAQVLRVVQPGHNFWLGHTDMKQRCRSIRIAARLYVDVADVDMPIKICLGSNVADEIVCRSRPDDLIVIGGSSQWLMENHASASIPNRVAAGTSGPIIMVLTNRGRPSALTDVFWDRTVKVGLRAADKLAAVESLVESLIESRQAPSVRRNEILRAVMERERAGVTHIGHGTAIPHAALRGFRGLAGTLGVFQDGIPFGKAEDDKARFVFLLLTPKESYDVYLPILARIARFMNEAGNRQQLAQAKSPGEVVELFEHAERDWRRGDR